MPARTYSCDPAERIVPPDGIRAFFARKGIQYIDTLVVDSRIEAQVKVRERRFLQDARKEEGYVQMENPHLAHTRLPDLALAYLGDEIGHGCFAAQDIGESEIVREYAGILTGQDMVEDRVYTAGFGPHPYSVRVEDLPMLLEIDAKNAGNESRFINHGSPRHEFTLPDGSRKSGVNVRSRMYFFDGLFRLVMKTTRQIARGEEIRSDYGPLHPASGRAPSMFFLDYARGELLRLSAAYAGDGGGRYRAPEGEGCPS